MALHRIDPRNEKSLHVSFDIDSLDPLEAPSTGTPGMSSLTTHLIIITLFISLCYYHYSMCNATIALTLFQ